jgi:hypothetical protein
MFSKNGGNMQRDHKPPLWLGRWAIWPLNVSSPAKLARSQIYTVLGLLLKEIACRRKAIETKAKEDEINLLLWV